MMSCVCWATVVAPFMISWSRMFVKFCMVSLISNCTSGASICCRKAGEKSCARFCECVAMLTKTKTEEMGEGGGKGRSGEKSTARGVGGWKQEGNKVPRGY